MKSPVASNRRQFLGASSALAAGAWGLSAVQANFRHAKKAKVAITLDLEMARNFPTWESTHWDYEKGNLNEEAKAYSLEAARRVKKAGGVIHFFVVGRVFEQPDVHWLERIVEMGHPIGNHTYDHVNVTATKKEDLQYRFKRSPWLLRGLSIEEAIRENIQWTTVAMKERLGIAPKGFRTPGGFADGLKNHPNIRALLLDLGYTWISSLYPAHPNTVPLQEPTQEILAGIVAAQAQAQPFRYSDGLIEVPMSPISDVGAFRNGRWSLPSFLQALEQSVHRTIDRGEVFDFLAHPSVLYVADPEFRAIDLLCKLVQASQDRAEIVDLSTIASSV